MSSNIDTVFREYHNSVNMSYSELWEWSRNPCSFQASLDRSPIKRNLHLLSTPKRHWTEREVEMAKKTISFNSRMRKVKAGKKIPGCGISARTISLRNWAYDPTKR